MDERNDSLAHSNDLDVTWGFDLDAFLREGTRTAGTCRRRGRRRDSRDDGFDSRGCD